MKTIKSLAVLGAIVVALVATDALAENVAVT